jgi:hypothetical protein
MIIALQLAAAALLLAPPDTGAAAGVATDAGPRIADVRLGAAAPAAPAAPADTTPRRRPRAVEVSDAYALRLRIHHYASYTMIPLFAAQTIAGNQMYQSGGSDPAWAKSVHGLGAAGLAALFTVNTVTGVWNLWESRGVNEGRTVKLVHSALMLASDAGFTYAGVKLGPDATHSFAKRQEHRRVAYISMGGALAGYATMLFANR